jgi:hypothetical protein
LDKISAAGTPEEIAHPSSSSFDSGSVTEVIVSALVPVQSALAMAPLTAADRIGHLTGPWSARPPAPLQTSWQSSKKHASTFNLPVLLGLWHQLSAQH